MNWTPEQLLKLSTAYELWAAFARLGVAVSVVCTWEEGGELEWSAGCLRIPIQQAFLGPLKSRNLGVALMRLAALAIERGWFTGEQWRATLAEQEQQL